MQRLLYQLMVNFSRSEKTTVGCLVYVNGKKSVETTIIANLQPMSVHVLWRRMTELTQHIYAISQRIASKIGNIDGFGADPTRVRQAGGKNIEDFPRG